MPVTISEDIYGSTHCLGYDTSQGERVIRRHFIEGVTGNSPLETAITSVVSGVTNFATRFPALSAAGMVRQNVTAKQVGVGKFIVEEQYSWASSSWGNFATTALVEYKLGYEGVQCYTVGAIQSNGLPGTIAQGASFKDSAGANALGFVPQPYTFMRPVIRIGRPIKTTSNPIDAGWFACIGKVNSSTVTILGTNYSAGQLRFDGAEVTMVTNSGYPFQGVMSFTAAPAFQEPYLYKSSGAWEIGHSNNYATAAFPAIP